jgi:hypothetical protein
MAGFQLTLYGRIWVTPEDIEPPVVQIASVTNAIRGPYRLEYIGRLFDLQRDRVRILVKSIRVPEGSRSAFLRIPMRWSERSDAGGWPQMNTRDRLVARVGLFG